jgi:Mn-dependent DtxR family transcriptional regulator
MDQSITEDIVNAMLRLEAEHRPVKTGNIVDLTGIARRAVQKEMVELERLGIVQRVGEGVHTTWRIT